MKKQLFILALAGLVMTSCDPMKDSGTFEASNPSADELLQGATFAQFNGIKAEDGTMTYEPCEDGNYLQFDIPKVSAVEVYYQKPDGSTTRLSYGRSGGMIYFKPTRGSEPVQTLYFKYINTDLKEVIATKEFTFQVAQELASGDKLLCSNSGKKAWYWYPTSTNGGAVWGNGGYQAGAITDPATGYPGAWWGCGYIDGDCANTFADQMNHSAVGSATGEEYSGSYMVFSEEGTITKYSPEGIELGSGSYKLLGYEDGEFVADGVVGYLETSAGAIMWPWMINSAEHFEPTYFEVAYLTAGNLFLIYAPEGTGSWAECTWWSFGNWDDAEGFLTTGKWGWYPTATNGGAVWGNGGYQAGMTSDPAAGYPGAWWGCGYIDGDCANTFADQMNHSAVGDATGEEYSGSYMLFGEDGILKKYSPEGALLGEGKWSAEMNTSEFAVGTLKTSAGAILWPWMINSADHFEPTEYEISYLSPTNLFLIYAPDGTGGWAECTWWSFGKLAE